MGARRRARRAPGDDTALVALLGHPDLPVRSWAGEGLARLGDTRALPVLAGTQAPRPSAAAHRRDHRLRRARRRRRARSAPGARRSRPRDPGALVPAIVARDAALAAAGIAPDLLVDAMSSPSAEIRFAAARRFERRGGDRLDAAAIARSSARARRIRRPRAGLAAPERRAAILQGARDTIASPEPGLRYAAAQVLARARSRSCSGARPPRSRVGSWRAGAVRADAVGRGRTRATPLGVVAPARRRARDRRQAERHRRRRRRAARVRRLRRARKKYLDFFVMTLLY